MYRHTISFRHALSGIYTALLTQPNLRVHLLIGSLVLFAAVALRLSILNLTLLLLVIGLVITTELINTAIEAACDAVTTDHHPKIKLAKDVAAGAVLFVSFFAVIMGIIIFIPALIAY